MVTAPKEIKARPVAACQRMPHPLQGMRHSSGVMALVTITR